MYSFLGILACLILIIIATIRMKNITNPLLMFSGIWLVILILNSLSLYNLRSTSERTYFLVFIGIISFGIGYLIVRIFRSKYTIKFNNRKYEYKLRYNLLYILGIVCIVYYLKNIPEILNIILSGGGLDKVRTLVQDSNSILNVRSGIENAIRILIIIPISLALESITAIDFWFGRRSKYLLGITITIIFLRVVTEGGRTPIVNFIIYMIIGYIFCRKKINTNLSKIFNRRIKKRYIILIVILGAVVLIYTTISREQNSKVNSLYYYFAMEPYMLDRWNNITESKGVLGYGMASLNGFIFPILYIFKNFIGLNFPDYWRSIYDLILLTDSQWQVITTNGISANAYVSIFWFFYLDGRTFGIILGMIIYAMMITSYFISAYKYPNPRNVSLYGLLFQGLFFSFIRFPFTNLYYSLAFLFILFIAYKRVGLRS